MKYTQDQLEQALKCSSSIHQPHQVWYIDEEQFDEPFTDPFIGIVIHSECETRNEAQRIANLVNHAVQIETKTPEREWYGFEPDFTVYPERRK